MMLRRVSPRLRKRMRPGVLCGGKAMLRVRISGLILLAFLMSTVLPAFEAQASRWGKSYFPDANVVTHDGKTLRLSLIHI